MKRKVILSEFLPLIEDLCNGFNLLKDEAVRHGYVLALSAVAEVALNLNILIRIYQSENGQFITRFTYDAFIDQTENGQKTGEIKMNVYSLEMARICAKDKDKEMLHGVRTWQRRNPPYPILGVWTDDDWQSDRSR